MANDIIPEGDYPMIAVARDDGTVDAEFGESAKKGTPYVRIRMRVTEGEFEGSVLIWDGYFSGGALRNTYEGLRKMGFKGDKLAAIPGQKFDKPFVGEVEHDTYNGRTKCRVGRIKGAPVDIAKLSAELEGQIRAFGAPGDENDEVPDFSA
jgi:hypothetical protein